MKVNIILLDYDRHQFTDQVMKKNFSNAGYEFSHVVIDKKGISAAINEGIEKSVGADAVVTMANDILMPNNWLAEMVEAITNIPDTGMCGIHCVEDRGKETELNGIKISEIYTPFGNVIIPMAAIEKIGLFNEDYDPYGMQDADFAHRLINTGHKNYYLTGLKAEHLGHDVGQPTDYRKMKDDGLSASPDKWGKWTEFYKQNGYKLK
jgi:GT2 family glycosyltransferase